MMTTSLDSNERLQDEVGLNSGVCRSLKQGSMRCDKALESADDRNKQSLGKPNKCDVVVSDYVALTACTGSR